MIYSLLRVLGADVNACDTRRQRSTLHEACRANNAACVALLLDRGATMDACDTNKRTALHTAARFGGKRVVQTLLERGARMEAADVDGHRPIDTAVKYKNLPALQCFLRKGAKLSSTTWQLAQANADATLALLHKLVDDGNLLYARHKLADATHRFTYAMKKRAAVDESDTTTWTAADAVRLAHATYAVMLGVARCKRRQGEYAAAIDWCTQAIRVPQPNANAFDAYLLRAKCHFDAANMPAAAGDVLIASRLNPANADVRQLMQTMNVQQGHCGQSDSSGDSHLDKGVILQLCLKCTGTDAIQVSPPPTKSISPAADCSSDSGNQADIDDMHKIISSNINNNNNLDNFTTTNNQHMGDSIL